MALILTDFGAVVTFVVDSMGDVVAAIVAQPLLLIPIAVGLLGTGIALVRKFM